MAPALAVLHALVFTGGIGGAFGAGRARACGVCAWRGIERNAASEPGCVRRISAPAPG